MSLAKITADIDALVAGHAPQGFEQPISVQFVGRQRGCIPLQPTVESAVRCYQRLHEARDGVRDVLSVRAAIVGGNEFSAQIGIRAELFHQLGNADAHDRGVFQYGSDIRLDCADFSFPAKAETERSIEHSESVELKVRAIVASVLSLRACSVCADVMA